MNDAENLVPQSLRNENTVQRKPFSTLQPRKQTTLGKSTKPKRRALGDITNKSSSTPLQTLKKPLSENVNKNSFQVWGADEEVPEPEFIPPPPPARPFQPPPLFSEAELAEMKRELEEEERKDDDTDTDEFGNPFLPNEEIPVPPPPYNEEEDVEDCDFHTRRNGLTKDYFSPDQLFTKEELPVLELA